MKRISPASTSTSTSTISVSDGATTAAASDGGNQRKRRKSMKKTKVNHTYRDFSKLSLGSVSLQMTQAGERVPTSITKSATVKSRATSGKKCNSTFPQRLYDMVTNPEYQHVICFMPHGRSWSVLDKNLLESEVLPKYFNHSKFESFTRQVNGWGFKRLLGRGPDYKSYYSEFFLRGRPELTTLMIRLVNPGKRIPDLWAEPDFYDISRRNPLPQIGESADLLLDEDVFDSSSGNDDVVKGSNLEENNIITPPHIHHQALIHPRVPSSDYQVPHYWDSFDASKLCQMVGTVPTTPPPAVDQQSMPSLYCPVVENLVFGTVPTTPTVDQKMQSLYCQEVVGNDSSPPSESSSEMQFDCQGMPNNTSHSAAFQVEQTSMALSPADDAMPSWDIWEEDMHSKSDTKSRTLSFSSDSSINSGSSHIEDFDDFIDNNMFEMVDISDFIAEPDPLPEPILVNPSFVGMDEYLSNIKKPGPLLADFAGIYFSNETE